MKKVMFNVLLTADLPNEVSTEQINAALLETTKGLDFSLRINNSNFEAGVGAAKFEILDHAYYMLIKFPATIVPTNDTELLDFIEQRLHPTADVDYFGDIIDNQADYIDEGLQAIFDAHSCLHIHFEHAEELTQEQALLFVKSNLRDRLIEFNIHDNGKDLDIMFSGN